VIRADRSIIFRMRFFTTWKLFEVVRSQTWF
jgi:hypothetical protein